MSKLKNIFISGMFAIVVGGTTGALLVAPATSAAPLTTCSDAGKFLTFPVWYRGLNRSSTDCELVTPDEAGGTSAYIWIIVLNVIEIALNAVGYITVGYIMYGGFLLMVGRGEPENITKARLTIRDAAIGLIISFGSVAIINLIVDPSVGIFK